MRPTGADTGTSDVTQAALGLATLIVFIETFRAIDRERLLGRLDDRETAIKRKELADLLNADRAASSPAPGDS